jgi:NADH-quinone oxidoreductase subunit E
MTAVEALLGNKDFQKKLDALVEGYPRPQTALIPALHLCQSELRHVPIEFQAFIAQRLGLPQAHVRGVVTFYEMFSEKPLGRYLLQVCKTLPCMLAGSETLLEHLQNRLNLKAGHTSHDGKFTLMTAECLACCDGGPALMVNEALYRRVSLDDADRILAELE